MKATFVIFLALVAFVVADVIPIVEHSEVRDEAGQFSLSYKSGDGTQLTEQGALKPNAEGDDYVLVKQGSVSYTSPDGTPISYTYVADEQGFRPEGAHLAKA